MRRSYLSPEYYKYSTNGTFNMLEESNFFGSKMLEIEDKLIISNQNIIYYQTKSGEQIDLPSEMNLIPFSYSATNDKYTNHTLVVDNKQTKFQMDNNTRWILDIKLKNILSNFLFAKFKQHRTFEGVRNKMTLPNDVNISINEYIKNNVLDRYKLGKIDLYVSYRDLRNQNVLRFKNRWPDIGSETVLMVDKNKVLRIQTETAFDGDSVKVMFNQEQPSSKFIFDYYFNLNFEKI
jgi:hypothetical protein